MALPTTGPISLGQVRTELNKTGSISLGSTDVRNLAGKASGIIKMSDLHGKSSYLYQGNLTVGYKIDEEPGEEGADEYFGYSSGAYGNLVPNTTSSGEIIYDMILFFRRYGEDTFSIRFANNTIAKKYHNKAITIDGIGSAVFNLIYGQEVYFNTPYKHSFRNLVGGKTYKVIIK
ncbi:hypothetical protein [Fusobacterium varium]|uniref:hypothetical protein n=1 Tax=Fusobacterium varium TaxID=856 RepID=UPI00356A7D81